MSTVIILTPIIIGSWPVISAAVTAAAVGLGMNIKETVQEALFKDFSGQTKSLGAWGGDFILATGDKKTPDYFKQKGFETVIPYSQMIKGS